MKRKSNKILKLLPLVLVLSLILVGCSGSPGTTTPEIEEDMGSIEGYVYMPVGITAANNELNLKSSTRGTTPSGYQSLEGAAVKVTGSDNNATTTPKGYFKIDNVEAGTQTVTIKKSGFDSISLVAEVKKGQTISVGEDSDDSSLIHKPKEWTFMVYIAGDNNLSAAAIDDINEMETVGSDENINIIVKADFSTEEYYDDLPIGPDGTYCYYIEQDDEIGYDISTIKSSPVFTLPEVDSGDPVELTKFIEWGTSMYPADKYAVVMWNHGSGWKSPQDNIDKGIAWDDVTGSNINTLEMKQALADTGVDFDIIGFDACVMGSLEIAYQLKDLGSVMVGSELNEPFDGWPYDTILADLQSNPTSDASTLGTNIVDNYIESFASGDVTMAAVDLSRLDTLTDSLDTAVTYIEDYLDYEPVYDIAYNEVNAYVDFYDLMDKIKDAYGDINLSDRIDKVLTDYDNMIIKYKDLLDYDYSTGDLYGLSVQLSDSFSGDNGNISYTELDFAVDSQWDDFITNVWNNDPNTIEGKVTIDGQSPGRELNIRVWNDSTGLQNNFKTDTEGNYSISSYYYDDEDNINIYVYSPDNYSGEEIDDNSLLYLTYVSFEANGSMSVPDIDLYNYGLSLNNPAHETVVTSYPVQIELSAYNGSDYTVTYDLRFFEQNGNYIGWSDDFSTNTSFEFDGTLFFGGSLTQDAYWLPEAYWSQGDFNYQAIAFGNYIYYGDSGSAVSYEEMISKLKSRDIEESSFMRR